MSNEKQTIRKQNNNKSGLKKYAIKIISTWEFAKAFLKSLFLGFGEEESDEFRSFGESKGCWSTSFCWGVP